MVWCFYVVSTGVVDRSLIFTLLIAVLSATCKCITVLYLYSSYISPNMYTATLYILGDIDSMDRSWHCLFRAIW
jgi:hypothetical protein